MRAVAEARRSAVPVLARGLGRSYGDAAQCAGGLVLDCTGLDRVLEAPPDTDLLHAEAGLSIDAALQRIVPQGWFLPVTPGTRQVTIGGAVAADVHGKNHHRAGTFGAHVERITLVTPRGRVEASPEEQADLFWATVGGMGLTGVVAEAVVRLHPIETAFMIVDTHRVPDLETCMAELTAGDVRHRYSVAWMDCLARGRHLGRSVISRGDHARRADLPLRQQARALEYRPRIRLAVPATAPCNVFGAAAAFAGNELWYRKAPTRRLGEIQTLSAFFHPLDAIGDWNRLYGPRGFTQYQFVVPFGAEATVRQVIEVLQSHRVRPTLAVLKRFGDPDPAPLSFPMAGWTLALDIPLGHRTIAAVLDELDELVAAARGRVYLAKDGRLRPELLRVMYPRTDEWLAVRERADPDGLLASDLWRRLGASNR